VGKGGVQALRAMNIHSPIPRGLPALSALDLFRLGSSSPMPPRLLASQSPRHSVLRTLKSGFTFALLHRPLADLHFCTASSPLATHLASDFWAIQALMTK
jgi:hypothetical protein